MLCRTYRGRARTQRGSGSEGSCVMRFKLIPRRSETLPLPPLLGHAVLMAALPLLAHMMQTHSLSLTAVLFFVVLLLLFFFYLAKQNRLEFQSFVCVAPLCRVYVLSNTSTEEQAGLNFMLGFKRAHCGALTSSNLFEISACRGVYAASLLPLLHQPRFFLHRLCRICSDCLISCTPHPRYSALTSPELLAANANCLHVEVKTQLRRVSCRAWTPWLV